MTKADILLFDTVLTEKEKDDDEMRQVVESFMQMMEKKIKDAIGELKTGKVGMQTADAVYTMANMADDDWYKHFFR